MYLVSIRITWFTQQKQRGLYQNKVTSNFAAIQRPGHWADNCKMVYEVPLIAAHSPKCQLVQASHIKQITCKLFLFVIK